jgi:4-amino-4-deoxy-L-arabinose transferase-like glycosyltransferase
MERSHLRLCALLVLFSLACFLPGFSTLQPMDRDEPRFAQASKQMLESGDFVDIRFQDEARHKKPVGIYWLQSAAVALADAFNVPDAHRTIAIYRLPSLLGALASVFLTYWAALAFMGRRGAFVSALLMAASVILMVEARLAKTDAVLLACSIAAMGGLARAYLSRGGGVLPLPTLATFWIGFAAGALIKGPMVLMFVGLTSLVLSVKERSWQWLKVLRLGPGLAFTILAILPWFIAIAVKSGGEFFAASVGHDMLGKVGTAQVVHWAPPGFYLLAFFATFWPGAILAAIAVPFAWLNRRTDGVAFLLAWIVPSWLVFEAVPTKLPHYVMPLYPAIAMLTVIAAARGFVGPHRPLAKTSTILIPSIPLALAGGLCFAAWTFDGILPYRALPVLAVCVGLSLSAWWLFCTRRVTGAIAAAAAASVVLAIGVFGFAQLDLRSIKLSPRLAEAAANAACSEPQITTLGYREPSLVFLTGTNLDMSESGPEAAAFLDRGGCRVALVERRFDDAFRLAAGDVGLRPALSTRVVGFNINSGRRVDIGVYSVAP